MPVTITTENHDEIITKTSNVLIDFTAKWCGPCKRMKPAYEKAESFIKELGIDLVFATVDVDDEGELSNIYAIKCMPTLILIKNGENVLRHEGAMSDTEILEFVGRKFEIPVDKQ